MSPIWYWCYNGDNWMGQGACLWNESTDIKCHWKNWYAREKRKEDVTQNNTHYPSMNVIAGSTTWTTHDPYNKWQYSTKWLLFAVNPPYNPMNEWYSNGYIHACLNILYPNSWKQYISCYTMHLIMPAVVLMSRVHNLIRQRSISSLTFSMHPSVYCMSSNWLIFVK